MGKDEFDDDFIERKTIHFDRSMDETAMIDLWIRLFTTSGRVYDPTTESYQGNVYCFFCNAEQHGSNHNNHRLDCVYIAARKLLAERGLLEWKEAATLKRVNF